MSYSVEPIGYVHSCFKEKFAIPRQPSLAPAAQGCIELLPPYNQADAIAGLDEVSHIWVIFLFHKNLDSAPRLKVRPPRLGGNTSIGVFASRATHRPNGIGQSAVRLERAEAGRLWISGIDLLDGTPVLDIKPYVPYADSISAARNTIADSPPELIEVSWQTAALQQAKQHAQRLDEPLIELIEQCLAQDPRPAYQQPTPERIYGVQFYDVQVRWRYLTLEQIEVLEVCSA
ncbi:MAG TPA: tRNA (N6-threonylcarbamoyladenosine(37)-N6)-methyltransferase TrmO [Thiopseudomonas sp.]|nr:tRNA (N6-threonylcarbamoyladenosine(37)-N6)-methyltransferase TrmO [Thiopseudomonas sp.]